MAKLSFVNDLADCVMELAMAKGAPLNTLSESVNWKQVWEQQQLDIETFDSILTIWA